MEEVILVWTHSVKPFLMWNGGVKGLIIHGDLVSITFKITNSKDLPPAVRGKNALNTVLLTVFPHDIFDLGAHKYTAPIILARPASIAGRI